MREQQSLDFDRVTFSLEQGENRKEEGLAQAGVSRKQLLEVARLYAVRIARRQGHVTSDDVFAEMMRDGLDSSALGNAAGSVFRGLFVFTGEWKKSGRVSNHARMNRIWRLRDLHEVSVKKPAQRVRLSEQKVS